MPWYLTTPQTRHRQLLRILKPLENHSDASSLQIEKGATSTILSADTCVNQAQRSMQRWNRLYAILLLEGLFICLSTGLVLLWYFNRKQNGFALLLNNHYLWTYGPTAILVLVVSVWRQVDHHYKITAPWIVLDRGAALAKHSLLADYISPIQVTSFWRSLRNGHFSVTITIFGFVILKSITLVSTGLLLEGSVVLPGRAVQLPLATSFNGSLYNETDYVTRSDASLVYTAYGVLAAGLENKPGMTDELVFQSFQVPNNQRSKHFRVTAEVDTLVPEFNCEPATVSVNPRPYAVNGSRSGDTLIITSPSCIMMGGEQPTFVLDANSEICPPRQLRGVMQRVNCSFDADQSPFPNHQLLTLVDVEYNQTLASSNSDQVNPDSSSSANITSFAVGIREVRSLLCRPGYRKGRLNLTHTTSGQDSYVSTAQIALNSERLPGFRDEDLASMFTSALLDAANMFGDLSDSRDAEEFPSTLFKIMAAPFGGRYEDLLVGNQTMAQAAESAFQHISVQAIGKNLLDTSTATVNGTIDLFEQRLLVNTIPFWIMIGGLVGLMILCLLLLSFPTLRLPRFNLATTSGVAQVAAHSPELQDVIAATSDVQEKAVSHELSRYHFFSNAADPTGGSDTLSISVGLRTRDVQAAPHGNNISSKEIWWNPLAIRRRVILTTLLLSLILVIVLEVLQVRSDSKGGLFSIKSTNAAANNMYSRFVPALIMLSIATAYNAIDFNISVLAPFNAMYDRGTAAGRSIKTSLIDKPPPVAIFSAAKNHQFAALCSSLAAIIGSVLTVVVSGLYTIDDFGSVDTSVLTKLDFFNTTWQNSAIEDNSAAIFTSLTESLDLPYPRNTYDELALPDFRSESVNATLSTVNVADIQVSVPALRSSLECSVLGYDSFNVSASYNPRLGSSSATVDVRIPLLQACPFGGPGGNLTFIEVNYRVGFAENSTYVGKLLDIHVGPYDAILGSSFGEGDPKVQRDNPPGCPSLALVFGFVDVDNSTNSSVTALMCYQQMQQVQTELTLTLPGLNVSTSKPPLPDESTVQLLSSSAKGDTAFTYRIQRHMDQSLSLFNQTKYASANLANAPVDAFFQGVLFGQKPLPESMLVGAENLQTIMSGVNAFYRRYMAQAISNNMRVDLNAVSSSAQSDATTTFTGKVTNSSNIRRLVQHKGSKLALQIMLGLMTVLGLAAWRLTRLTDLVPYNPCTIFGVMLLLAGSQMCENPDRVPIDGGQENDGPGSPRTLYRLGWWEARTVSGEHQMIETSAAAASPDSTTLRRRRRYGIDVVAQAAL